MTAMPVDATGLIFGKDMGLFRVFVARPIRAPSNRE